MTIRKYDNVCTITGVSGFVGSNLARALLNNEEGVRTRVFGVDFEPSDRLADVMRHDDFEFFDYDVRQPLRSDLLAVDAFYHFAGIADPKRYLEEPINVMDLNLVGLRNVLERIVFWSHHRPRVIYSSTSEVYGKSDEVPFNESSSSLVFGPTNRRRWCYAMTKAVGEHYLQSYHDAYGIPYTIFRFFNFVGDDIDAPGAGRVITKMVGDAILAGKISVSRPGSQTRCFTYTDDFVVPLVRASTYKLSKGSYRLGSFIVNLGSDQEVSMMWLARKIAKRIFDTGAIHWLDPTRDRMPRIELVDGEDLFGAGYDDAIRRVPDVNKAREVFDWTAQLRIEDYLPKIVDAAAAAILSGRGAAFAPPYRA